MHDLMLSDDMPCNDSMKRLRGEDDKQLKANAQIELDEPAAVHKEKKEKAQSRRGHGYFLCYQE